MIEIFWWEKVTWQKGGPFGPFNFQMALALSCKNTSTSLCSHPNTYQKEKLINVVSSWYLFSLAWIALEASNPWVAQDQGSKSIRVGFAMMISNRVQTPSLVNAISIHWWEELNVVEGSACNCICPMWRLTSYTMATKVLWITSWVLVRSLPWMQHKRWIHNWWNVCTCIKGYLQLRDVVI